MKKTISLLLLISSTIFARQLTLDQAIDLSLENSKEVKISSKNMEKAKLNVSAAFKDALPSVVYSGSYGRSEYARKIEGKNSRQVEAKGGYRQKITISQPIFQGGAVIGGIKYAKAYSNIANLSFLGDKRDVRLDTIATYSNIVKDERNLEALEGSKKELEATYEKQKAQLDLRLVTKADLLKTEYTILDIQSQIIGINNNIKVNKEKLRVRMGLKKGEDISVVNFDVPKDLTRTIDFNKDLDQAMNKSIDALIANHYVDMADASKTVARADMLPKVSAFASYGVESDRRKFNQTMDDAEWRGGVQVTWNVFEFGKNYDNYKIADLNVQQEELKEQISKDNIDIRVTDAYLNLVKMEKERVSKERALQAAQENFNIDKEKYMAGLISTIDFLISETQLRDAKVSYNQVVVDYLYAFEKYRSMLI